MIPTVGIQSIYYLHRIYFDSWSNLCLLSKDSFGYDPFVSSNSSSLGMIDVYFFIRLHKYKTCDDGHIKILVTWIFTYADISTVRQQDLNR